MLRWLMVLLPMVLMAAETRPWKTTGEVPWAYPTGNTPIVLTIRSKEALTLQATAAFYNAEMNQRLDVPVGVSQHTLLLPPILGEERDWGDITVRLVEPSYTAEQLSLSKPANYSYGGLLIANDSQYLSQVNEGLSSQAHNDKVQFISPSQVPAAWQVYPPWLRTVITGESWQALRPDQQQALLQANRCGHEVLPANHATIPVLKEAGFIIDLDPSQTLARWVQMCVANMNGVDTPDDIPVPGTDKVPLFAFIAVALIVAILAGPINLWWCKKRRRELLLLTTPLIGVGASVFLITAALLSDGISVKRSSRGAYIMSDGMVRYAVPISYFPPLAASDFNVATSDALRLFNYDDFYELHNGYRYWRGESTARPGLTLKFDGDQQQVSGPWLPSRLNRQLILIGEQRFRGRIQLVQESSQVYRVTNGLEIAVHNFLWRDGNGSYWYAEHIAPGQQLQLQPNTDSRLVKKAVLDGGKYSKAFAYRWQSVQHRTYQAVMDVADPLLPLWGPDAVEIAGESEYRLTVNLPPSAAASMTTGGAP